MRLFTLRVVPRDALRAWVGASCSRSRLDDPAPVVQQRLGISVWLYPTLEDQLASAFEGDGIIKVGGHRSIKRIADVLLVDDRSHILQDPKDLRFTDHAVIEPVS